MTLLYASTIFLSAFLLFQVQPLMGRFVLPWFGGGPGVWTTCMLFFQLMLLAGYAYAHLLNTRVTPRRQPWVHLALLGASLLALPIVPDAAWKPSGAELPMPHILALLAAHVAVPFTVLAASAPLLPSWHDRLAPGRAPYRFYALSNAGSLLALLGYPFVIEPALALRTQGLVWSAGYTLFVLLCGACAWRTRGVSAPLPQAPYRQSGANADAPSPTPGVAGLWLALSATGSVMLLATTSHVTQELTVVPMLWIMPLSIYLLTFILSFERPAWYDRRLYGPALALAAGAMLYVMRHEFEVALAVQIASYAAAQFVACMVCHGELARLKPATRDLSRFYLVVALGGALGGLAVALVSPVAFRGYWEYHLALGATCALALVCVRRDRRGPATRRASVATGAAVGAVGILLAGLWLEAGDDIEGATEVSRSFFGVVRILSERPAGAPVRVMVNGRTSHGSQFLAPGRRHVPTTYYARASGVGAAIDALRGQRAAAPGTGLRIGVIGLGAGTLAALGNPGDDLRFYEISPDVERLARAHFSYLRDSPASIDVVIGDARVVLEREAAGGTARGYDLLVIDAFSSDAVPLHLLTREAYALYVHHLAPDGLIAFHTSNRYLDVAPAIRGLAAAAGHTATRIITERHDPIGASEARWILTSAERDPPGAERLAVAATPWTAADAAPFTWSDDYASIWHVLGTAHRDRTGRWSGAPNAGYFVADDARLLGEAERGRMRHRFRKLYHDTGGAAALMVVSIESLAASGAGALAFDEFASAVFRGVGMTALGERRGIMLLVSRDDRRATLRLGAGWSEAFGEGAMQALARAFNGVNASGGYAPALSAAVAAIDTLARNALADSAKPAPK